MKLKGYIIKKSKELNIDIIGFTDCQILSNLEEYLIKRKIENRQIEFEEKDIKKRLDPCITFPKCKTIIVLGLSYNTDFIKLSKTAGVGKLSKSSWGLDYHKVLREKINSLIKEIQKVEDFEYKVSVDTGPLIERELAYKAGIGYYGKNCSIINPKYGSFIFLGYILTDLYIDTLSTPIQEDCRNCNLCIKACPTKALESPYKFNPKSCISYLTQTKKKIPYKLRGKMNNSIYGCDICQKVCPKNKNISKGNHKEFIPKDRKTYIDIKKILSISNKQFKEEYGAISGGWRGKNILKRNAIIALGNMKDRKHLPILESLLKDSSPMIRKYTAWSILNIDYGYGIEVIKDILEYEKDEVVKSEMEKLMNYFNTNDMQK